MQNQENEKAVKDKYKRPEIQKKHRETLRLLHELGEEIHILFGNTAYVSDYVARVGYIKCGLPIRLQTINLISLMIYTEKGYIENHRGNYYRVTDEALPHL